MTVEKREMGKQPLASLPRPLLLLVQRLLQVMRTCNNVEFILVMRDESDKTRELCQRAKITKVPHFSFYKSMEKIHEEGIGPDQLMGDVLYYGDSHSSGSASLEGGRGESHRRPQT
ncbi:hypothetical protein V6N13_120182 [Hibiscus sabdariffa]